jgi:acylphosphatase
MNKTGYHIKVQGTVQGVGYRYLCSEAGTYFGLDGFVMNMPDGSVELEVFGTQVSIDGFIRKISGNGGSHAVEKIEKYEIPENKKYVGFQILQYPGY